MVDMGSLEAKPSTIPPHWKKAATRYQGKLYGMPIDTTRLLGCFYNKAVFEEAGIAEVPTTWDEFLDACGKDQGHRQDPLYYSGSDSWTLQCFTHFGFNKEVLDSGLTYTEFWDEMNTNKRHYSECQDFRGCDRPFKE